MEIGNEKQNTTRNECAGPGTKRQGQWKAICGPDQRFYFVNFNTNETQWLPPKDLWSSKFGLPYGWEACLAKNSIKYYINHVKKISTLEDPRTEEEQSSSHLQMAATRARKVQIKRDPSLGFGFVAGSEKPVVIRSVISGGPSHGKLFSNDQILKVNGEDVSEVPQERVISLIKACSNELVIHVVSSEDLQDAKNQGQRRSSLMSRATRERRRSSPVSVRFADDMVQYIGPAEQARRASLPALPNVLKVFLENGQTRSFHYNPKTTVQEIFSALGPKLDIKAMENFCLVLSGPRKNQLSFLQNHEKVSEIYLNRNCSRSSWVCKLRICFIPRDPNELLESDPVAFDYLYDQISNDIVEGLFEIDLRYDLAIKLAALHMQQKATEAKHKMPTKISVKSVEKEFDGLEHFLPENIINGVKLKDLRKVLDQQIKFNQSLATLGQRYLTSKECKKLYLKLASELVSYGGKYFNVILYSNDGGTGSGGIMKARKVKHQEACVLVSPKYGLSQMVKGKVNVLCQLAELEQILHFSISFHAEGKRLLTITMADNKDLVLLMKPLDSMDLVTFIVGYQKLWNCTTAKLTIKGEKQEPLAPLTDHDIPVYVSLHRVIPDTWSYPSFLQVPGSNCDHHFNLDLTKKPPKLTPSNGAANGQVNESSSEDVLSNHTKRSSEEVNAANEADEEVLPFEFVSGKRFKVDNSDSSSEREIRNSLENENDTEVLDSPNKARTLYSIAEESQHMNNEEREPDEDDYISQLNMAEEFWRRNRNEKIEISLEMSSNESGDGSHDSEGSNDDNPDEIKKSNQILVNDIENKKDGETVGMVVDDEDSEEEIERFYDETNSSDEETNNRNNKDNLSERTLGHETCDKGGDESEHQVSLEFSKKDDVVANEPWQGRNDDSLDINDIDFDDNHSGTSENDSLDLLADFSFTGDMSPHANGSPADAKNEDMHEEKFHSEVDVDHDDREDTVDTVSKDSTDGFTLTHNKKPYQEMRECDNSSELSSSNFEDTSHGFITGKLSNFDKKENYNFRELGESDFQDNFKDCTSHKVASSDKDDKNRSFVENDVDKARIQLLSDKQSEDQNVLITRRSVKPNKTKDFKEESSGDGSSVDGDNALEEKDSDLSSLTSQSSLQLSNIVNGGFRNQDSRFVSEEQNKSADLNAKGSSNEISLDEFDTSTDKSSVQVTRNVSDEINKVGQHETHRDAFVVEKIDEDNEGDSRNVLIPSEHENNNSKVSKMQETSENAGDVTTKDLKNPEGKSSPVVLLLGNDPGESEDTSENVDRDFFKNSDTVPPTKDEIDYQEYSLMDWIIPPPPGSTEELLDSDILVASPPPTSPTFESISSPPVELNEDIFNESEIDDMILPPPPMGTSFSSDIRIVSPPPPSRAKSSIHKEGPISIGIHENNVESNRQQLDNLTLGDSPNVVGDEFVPVHLAQSRSSESSGSVFTDDYNSSSMVSCYSMSNDSQRTSEDEFFDEERTEVFGEIQDRSVGNVALIKLLEPGIKDQELENLKLNSYEEEPSFDETQPTERIMEIQLERTVERKRGNEKNVSARDKSSENDPLEMIDQDTDVPTNGLPCENDYDCLDEILFMEENDNLSNEGFEPTLDLPQDRSALLSKNHEQLVERTDPLRLGKFENSTWFSSQGKVADTERMKNSSPTLLVPKRKDDDTKQQQILIDSEVVNSSNVNPSPVTKATSVFLPGHLIKESNTTPSGVSETDHPLEFGSDAVIDKDQSPPFRSKTPGKRTMDKELPSQHRKHMVFNGGKLDSSFSDESVKIDGAGAVDEDGVGENGGEMGFGVESSILIRSCFSAKIETLELTERLKLRLQGCVDDCQNSVLKSSYLPYANSNKWKEGVHDNAVLLGSDIKRLNTNVQEMNSDIIPMIKTSLETLQSLVSSFVLASSSHQRISLYSVRMLAGILNDVISLYNEVIIKVEEAVRLYPDKSKLQSVAEKSSSMTALIASLRRTLKRL